MGSLRPLLHGVRFQLGLCCMPPTRPQLATPHDRLSWQPTSSGRAAGPWCPPPRVGMARGGVGTGGWGVAGRPRLCFLGSRARAWVSCLWRPRAPAARRRLLPTPWPGGRSGLATSANSVPILHTSLEGKQAACKSVLRCVQPQKRHPGSLPGGRDPRSDEPQILWILTGHWPSWQRPPHPSAHCFCPLSSGRCVHPRPPQLHLLWPQGQACSGSLWLSGSRGQMGRGDACGGQRGSRSPSCRPLPGIPGRARPSPSLRCC